MNFITSRRDFLAQTSLGLALIIPSFATFAADDRIVLTLEQASKDGLVVARVDLTAAARWCNV